VSVAQAFSVNNMALTGRQMRELVARKWQVNVSRQWVTKFLARHRSILSKRACKALSDKRAGMEVFDGVVDFCKELKDFLSHYSFPSHAVINYDETRVVQKGEKLVLRRVEAANKERANVRSTRHQTVASLLTFVAADGSVLLSVYILKGRFGDGDEAAVNFRMEDAPRVTRGTWPRFYVWNDSGTWTPRFSRPCSSRSLRSFTSSTPVCRPYSLATSLQPTAALISWILRLGWASSLSRWRRTRHTSRSRLTRRPLGFYKRPECGATRRRSWMACSQTRTPGTL